MPLKNILKYFIRMKSVQNLTSFKPLDKKKSEWKCALGKQLLKYKKNQHHYNLRFSTLLSFSYKLPFLPQLKVALAVFQLQATIVRLGPSATSFQNKDPLQATLAAFQKRWVRSSFKKSHQSHQHHTSMLTAPILDEFVLSTHKWFQLNVEILGLHTVVTLYSF